MKYFAMKLSGVASFAQERIFLDQQVRFSSEIAIYNELNVLRVVKGSLSKSRLLVALQSVLQKHTVLRTSLTFNNQDSTLKQCVTDKHHTYTLATEQTFKNEDELHDIIYRITIDPYLFDLSNGRVFYCQILRPQMLTSENTENQFITDSDVLVIAFHHAAYDRSSRQIFFNDLCTAYNSNIITEVDEELLQYIDYAVHEHQMDMLSSQEFWHLELEGCNLQCQLSLPTDRHRSSTDQRSGLASGAHIYLDNDVTTSFLNYASSHQLTPFQLGLATLYAFLFKLTRRQNDLCIACLNANRYRTELQNMIGMFVATLPYRIRLDQQWSFDELVQHIREKCLSILEHSHYPLQNILADSHLTQSNALLLETLFDFITAPSHIDQIFVGGATLEPISSQQLFEVTKFDFMLMFAYNPTLDDDRLSYHLLCSRDLFDATTVITIARRFQRFFSRIFSSNFNNSQTDQSFPAINKLSLSLPEEAEEMQRVIFRRLPTILNEGMFFFEVFLVH
jgi:hypothetical protein